MDLDFSLWLFQALHALGLAVWLSLSVVNNIQGFAGSVAAVGATMNMAPLKLAPIVDTPLLARALRLPALHRAALLLVLALQIVAACAFWAGAWPLLLSDDLAAARPWLNLGLSAFSLLLFAMHLGGLWFGYWIRQEGLQQAHISLLLWTVAAFLLFNLSWA